MDYQLKIPDCLNLFSINCGSSVKWMFTCRWTLAFVGFLGFVNLYTLRVNLSVAMVCMVNSTAVQLQNTRTQPAGDNTSIVGLGAAQKGNTDVCGASINTTLKV